MDDQDDFQTLRKLVYQVMTSAAFESGHRIIQDFGPEPDSDGSSRNLVLTAETNWKALMDWVDGLPEREPPTYLGLPPNAEKILLVEQAKGIIGSLRNLLGLLEEGEHFVADIGRH